MTFSWPSFLAASTSASMPPKSSADVASLAFTPDCVCSPSLFFSGGAQAASPATREHRRTAVMPSEA